MKAALKSMILVCTTWALLLGGALAPGAARAEEAGTSCRALYVAKLRVARDAAARGDQKSALAGLEEAQDVLRSCTEGPSTPGGKREDEASAKELGRVSQPIESTLPAA